MNKPLATEEKTDERQRDESRIRDCLRCRVPFPSSWFGERICPKCKSTNNWRTGAAFSTHASGRRR